MPLRRYKRNQKAYALSKRLRRRFYKGAATATIAYVSLSLISFHAELPGLPFILSIIWAIFLLCYITLKEVLRWIHAGDEDVYHGEFWTVLIIAGAAWMSGWNIARGWFFSLPPLHVPEDYNAVVVETIVLFTLSTISSFLYRYKMLRIEEVRAARRRASARARARIAAESEQKIKAVPAIAKMPPDGGAETPKPETILAKAKMPDQTEPPAEKNV